MQRKKQEGTACRNAAKYKKLKKSEAQKKICLTALLVLVVSGLGAVENLHAETIKIGGTGFGIGVMKLLARSFEGTHPVEEIEVVPSLGSSGGIKALLHGALDIAISGRPLKPEESGKGIEATEFTRTPFIFMVNESVAKKTITLQELEKIYRGEELAWPNGGRIRPVLRPDSDSVTQVVRKLSPGMDQAMTFAMSRKGMILAITDQQSAQVVEKTTGALAAGTLTQVYSEKLRVNILSFNGITPSVTALCGGAYPLSIPLYLVTPARPGKTSLDFLRFLFTEEGRKILAENGNMIVAASWRREQ